MQQNCIEILISNLGDDDFRVRSEAAKSLIEASFFWPQDGSDKCTVTRSATLMAEKLLIPIIGQKEFSEKSHKRLFYILQTRLMTSKSSTMTSGLVEALLRLFQVLKSCETQELLQECSKMLSSRNLVCSDIIFHGNLFKLVAKLVEATRKKSKVEAEYKELTETSQEILTHCFIILNITQHLIEATTPIQNQSGPKSQVDQNSITNPNTSPIKKPVASQIVQDLKAEFRPESPSKSQSELLGHFSESHHYIKIYENLKSAFMVQRNSLDGNHDKIKMLVFDCLDCLSSILEYAPINGKISFF